MASPKICRRNDRTVFGLLTGMTLVGVSVLWMIPAAAETPTPPAAPTASTGAEATPAVAPPATVVVPAAAAPTLTAPAASQNGFDAHAVPIPKGRAGGRRSLTLEQEKAGLPKDAPSYFSRIFHSIFQAPRPAQIFREGGIPPAVPEHEVDADPTGRVGSYQPLGQTATATNAFFQSLGENGRSCVTCHLPPNAMSVSLDNINTRWNATSGTDPIFAAIDGADCPNKVSLANLGELDPRTAHSLLLNRGLFRIFLTVPPAAEFQVEVVSDPTDTANPQPPFNKDGCNTDPAFAIATDVNTGNSFQQLSMYRRPRIAANLPFVMTTRSDLGVDPPPAIDPITGQPVAVGTPPVTIDPRTGRPVSGNIMWDGREPTLEHQASDATQGHAQAPNPPTSTQIAEMVQFELGIFSAQVWDAWALELTAEGGLGGPEFLSGGTPGLPAGTVPVPLQAVPIPAPPPATGTASFPLFDAWASLAPSVKRAAQRESVARGQAIFQTRVFTINGVAGLNNIGGVKPSQSGTCSTCHNQANTGNDSFPAAQHDIGIGGTKAAPGVTPPTGAPTTVPGPSAALPIFKLTCNPGKSTVYQGPIVVTNDPGLALITGLCADIGRFTVPQLRGLAARAPYFSDGSAATLLDVVTFYNNRFAIQLSNQDLQDLVAFLRSL